MVVDGAVVDALVGGNVLRSLAHLAQVLVQAPVAVGGAVLSPHQELYQVETAIELDLKVIGV